MASVHDESGLLQAVCSIKYHNPFAYGHDPSAPTRRMSTLRDQTLTSTRVHPYPHRRPVPAASPSSNPSVSPVFGVPPQALVGNRPVLPSLASTFTNVHSDQQDMLSSRSQAMRSGEGFSHSFAAGGIWDNNPHSPMADHPYNYTSSPLNAFDPRQQYHTPTPPQGQGHGLRRSPNSLTESHRRPTVSHPQISIATTGLGLSHPPRDEPSTSNWTGVNYYASSYPANFALASGPPDVGIHSPTTYPAPNYGMAAFHTGSHHSSTYPTSHAHATIDPRQPPHHTHSPYQPGTHPSMSSHRPSHANTGPWEAHQREHAGRGTEAHLVSPYSRTAHPEAKETSISPQDASPIEFPAVKKKRRRADANQLKVLNDVYARTAFPTTEERLDLARRLDMSARSVQIWFQNKRQSSRSRNVSNAANPSMLHHPYLGSASPSSLTSADPVSSHMPMPMPVPSHPHAHGLGRPGAEVSVSPSAAHGGSYTVYPHPASGSYPSSFSGTHRPESFSHRAQSPSHMDPLSPEGASRRARSPEGSSRLRARTPAGRP